MKLLIKMFLAVVFILGFSSCSFFMPNRSFEDQMGYEPESFFVPDQDFRVTVGDTGQRYRTQRQVLLRTPPSAMENKYLRENAMMEEELNSLKESLSPQEYAFFTKYEDKLGSASNKIYFLKIQTMREKEEYLYNLGIYQSPYHTSPEETIAIKNQDVLLGMSKKSVMKAWGKPERVEVAGDPRHENERWAYSQMGKRKYVYFSNGFVEGWENESSGSFDF